MLEPPSAASAREISFTGDAEEDEENEFDVLPATLLQAGHHGSDTSSNADFIAKVQPPRCRGRPFVAAKVAW